MARWRSCRRCCRAPPDVAADYLPLTRANMLRQAFKFLGERYGWGHSTTTRATAAASSPRSTAAWACSCRATPRDQAREPGAEPHRASADNDSHAKRVAVVRELQVGDLVYIPGHVMMVIGHERRRPT